MCESIYYVALWLRRSPEPSVYVVATTWPFLGSLPLLFLGSGEKWNSLRDLGSSEFMAGCQQK